MEAFVEHCLGKFALTVLLQVWFPSAMSSWLTPCLGFFLRGPFESNAGFVRSSAPRRVKSLLGRTEKGHIACN